MLSFDPASWLYGVISDAVFGPKKSLSDDEAVWERSTTEELLVERDLLDRKWKLLENKINPNLREADEDFDAWSYFMTLSKAARITDWTKGGVYELSKRYHHVQWAYTSIKMVAAAVDDDDESSDAFKLATQRLRELSYIEGYSRLIDSARLDLQKERKAWTEEQTRERALLRAKIDQAAAAMASAEPDEVLGGVLRPLVGAGASSGGSATASVGATAASSAIRSASSARAGSMRAGAASAAAGAGTGIAGGGGGATSGAGAMPEPPRGEAARAGMRASGVPPSVIEEAGASVLQAKARPRGS